MTRLPDLFPDIRMAVISFAVIASALLSIDKLDKT
jgi:hypothetical protein